MKDKDNIEKYSLGGEIANSITHGIEALLSVAGTAPLIVIASVQGGVARIISAVIYGLSLFLLYISSMLYHAIKHKTAKHVFEILDHSAIYVLIAGSYTPFLLLSIRETLGRVFLIIVWLLTAFGIIFKVFFVRKFVLLSTVFYILMGWMVVLIFKPMTTCIDSDVVLALISGGIMYTFGTVFYVWRKFKFHHMIWHIFVLFVNLFHYLAILKIIVTKV
jgi:hemolysin III